MPTHIYTRLGDWDAVVRGNLRAAEAALKYPAGERGEFVWDEFPHAVEYLVYAHLQKGDDEAAAAYRRSLELYPRRFNGLLGAARAARALGDEAQARSLYKELLQVAGGGTRKSELAEAQSYVSRPR